MAWLPKSLQHPLTEANEELFMRVQKYTVKKHQGLWRFYHDTKKIPVKKTDTYVITDKNIARGKVVIKKGSSKQVSGKGITAGDEPITVTKPDGIECKTYTRKTMWEFEWHWWEQDHWAWDDKTGDVWRFKMSKDGDVLDKKKCGYVQPGTDPHRVLAQILDRDITINDAYDSQAKHYTPKDDGVQYRTLYKFSTEFDGKSILALCIVKPKMTYKEIVQIIEGEGGWVDDKGIVHAAANPVFKK